MDDVPAVMDAVGSGQAALLGASEGGLMPFCALSIGIIRQADRAR